MHKITGKFLISLVILTALFTFSGCEFPLELSELAALPSHIGESANESIQTASQKKNNYTETISNGETLKIHYIDVGQGDSILIEQSSYTMLIDAGENNKGTDVVKYLNTIGIDDIDYIVGTHPHSDHIGGLDTVINSVEVSNAIIPDAEHTTKTYEAFIDALLDNDVETFPSEAGSTYSLGKASFTILAPNSDKYDNLNNYSVVIKLTFGNNSFLFCGDAEVLSENEMLNNNYDLSSDVIKIGHHGSTTSSSETFIEAVSPEYAVICCGEDNSYGHPHDEITELLGSKKITTYRTDLNGTVVVESDGNSLNFTTENNG